MEEASRCLNCKNAKCIQGCPVSINIPEFVAKVKDGDIEGAYKVIGESSALPASQVRTHFLQSADVYVHRSHSVRANVSVVSRESRFPLVNWKDSLRIMH